VLGCLLTLVATAGCEGIPTAGSDEAEDVGVVRSAVTSGAAKINCGAAAVAPFIADTDASGGSTITRANTIDTSAVYNPAPATVYQSQRFGNFTYTLPGFGANSWNQVRLHFADTHWTSAGQRVFNVTINGKAVLTNFDIVKLAGAGNKALVEQFAMQANGSGQYVIVFTTVVDAATVSGIEVGPVTASGTPTKLAGTAYAKQCQQQLVPLPPNFGGTSGGTQCSTCFAGTGQCTGCKAGAWTYSGQLSNVENEQSFNGSKPVDMFFWQSTAADAPGLCMMAARKGSDAALDFVGVICQSAAGAVCFWDRTIPSQMLWDGFVGGPNENGHVIVPNPALTITSTTSIPTPAAFVGGDDLIATSATHSYQQPCSDCHSGRNAFNNHPFTATDLPGRGLISSAAGWFPAAWPSPIVADWDPGASALGAPWPLNPGPGPAAGFAPTVCFGCHTEGGSGGIFPSVSTATPNYCGTMLMEATRRSNHDCSGTDINCPTGAMPASLAATPPSSGDQFALAMLSHRTGQCSAEFRTTLAQPRLASGTAPTLTNAAGTLSTTAYVTQDTRPATTFGINSSGKVVSYDPMAMKWTTSTQAASQISLGSDRGLWMIKKSGSTSFICAANADLCTGATCTWTCDSVGYSGYAGIIAGNGGVIWAIDQSKLGLWAFFSGGAGQYMPDSFFAMGEWDPSDPIAQVSVGGDGDMWVLTALGHVQHQSGGTFNAAWTTVASPPGGTAVSLAVANSFDVWTASNTGLYRYDVGSGTWEKHCLTSGSCTTSFTTVAAGGRDLAPNNDSTDYHPIDNVADVWALDTAGNAYRVDRTKGTTQASIIKVGGATLTRISVGGQGDVVGINSSGTVFSFQ